MGKPKGPRETAFIRSKFTEPVSVASSGVAYVRINGKWVLVPKSKRKRKKKVDGL